jgi:hypothetical protein
MESFNSLNIVKDYVLLKKIYQYLNEITYHKNKNVWNSIVIKWIQMHNENKDNKDYLNSEYSKQKYTHIHDNIVSEELNLLLGDFIGQDLFKALFVVNCINNLC